MASEGTDVFRLYLVRHAHAGWASPGERDYDRPLDTRGLAEARSVALQAYTAGFEPEQIISSPARRCAETTAIFLEVFGNPDTRHDERLYSDGLEAYLRQIQSHAGKSSLMLVGHNPMIEALATSLARQGELTAALGHGYPTAGLVALDFARPVAGDLLHRGTPVALLTPALN